MNRTARLEAIYARIPEVHCKGLCQECCGAIGLSAFEAQRMGGVPHLTGPDGLTCSYLDSAGRCSVYERRPLICRLWGAMDTMRCPHGCVPDRTLTLDEILQLWRDWSLVSSRALYSIGRVPNQQEVRQAWTQMLYDAARKVAASRSVAFSPSDGGENGPERLVARAMPEPAKVLRPNDCELSANPARGGVKT